MPNTHEPDTQAVLDFLDTQRDSSLERLKQLLAIPSISTNPANKADMLRTAELLDEALRELDFEVRIMPTADGKGHPVVVGRYVGEVMNPDAPRPLIYGHYDVQPPEPLEGWHTPPFEPTIRRTSDGDEAIYARGASDDKGQVWCFIEAMRAWKKVTGKLPGPVSVIIEGEEEIGSANLPPFIEANKELLAADVVLVSDTTMWDEKTVGITYGLRGLAYFDIQLHGPSRDLHSGFFGGAVPNPAVILTQVLGRLFDEDNRVTIPGFYDDVIPLTQEERDEWAALNFDETAYLNAVGLKEPFGEKGYTTLERKWARPSCDINGLYGGYGGPGAKTVIPSFAGAKVSFRLVPGQNARKIVDAFETWLKQQDVKGLTWKIERHGAAPAIMVNRNSRFIAAAQRACEITSGKPAVLVREGGSIPIVADFKSTLGLDTLLVGFGLNNDCIHAPNEKFNLDCFYLGCRTQAAILADLAKPAT